MYYCTWCIISFNSQHIRQAVYILLRKLSGYTTMSLSWRLVEQGLTSHSTQFRSFRRLTFLQVRWPNQQCQSTEGGWLVIQIALNLIRLISPCYN